MLTMFHRCSMAFWYGAASPSIFVELGSACTLCVYRRNDGHLHVWEGCKKSIRSAAVLFVSTE